MKKLNKTMMVAIAATAILASCGRSNSWQVEGKVENGEGKLVSLEASNNGMWYMLDTLTLSSNGKFKFQQPAAGFPDIYRLTVDGSSVYFPVDSIETVTVDISSDGKSPVIKGSAQAKSFMKVDSLVNASLKANGSARAIADDADLKKKLADLILVDPSGVTAYYAINKRVGDTPLYSVSNRNDLRIIGAVANAFDLNRPNDPRTTYLKRLYLSNRPQTATTPQPGNTVVANEVSMIDIELLDPSGRKVKLSDIAGKGNVVVLSFTSLTANEAPSFNLELGKVYEERHPQGLEIYQVSVDNDEFAWRRAAKNLPWVSVYNNPNDMTPFIQYNVGALPMSFILDKSGAIVERVTDITTLNNILSKYM